MDLKLKICGIKNTGNANLAMACQPDYLGFIFYPESPRYTGKDPSWIQNLVLPGNIEKVGVFVNVKPEDIVRLCEQSDIRFVQLHGKESPEVCKILMKAQLKVMKVFHIGPGFSFDVMNSYSSMVDYFLFDTKGQFLGGNGVAFDWRLIEQYPFHIPFFLSGGIGLDNIENIRYLNHDYLYGLDVNSGLESGPGEKDSRKIRDFKKKFELLKL
jgi:phosphoribosylanthranilate isomerase